MPISLNPLTPIVEFLKLLYPPLADRICYLKDIHENSRTLDRRRNDIERQLKDLEREIEREERKGRSPTEEAKGWLADARKLSSDAPGLIEDASQRGCCRIWCLNCCSSYNLGRDITKTVDLATELLDKRKNINTIAADPLPGRVLPIPTTTIKENTSPAAAAEEIRRHLGDRKTGKIGIWGQRGIGKSTILQNVYNNFEGTSSDFGAILFVEFPKDGSLKTLQRRIAEELSVDLSKEEDGNRKSRKLLNEFNKRKKFLLILDDVSEVIKLLPLGVPEPSEQNGCKILFAAEKKEICSRMDVNVEIELCPFPPEEAWELFSFKVGAIPPEIQEIARVVCQECSGVAAFLSSFGTALRNQQLYVWERALGILKSPESRLLDPEVLAEPLKGVDVDQMQQYVEQASVESVIKDILKYLSNDHIKLIGIWGMGGVGKTRIVKDVIYQKLKDKSSFDVVIYATASRNRCMKALRRDVGKEINLELPDEEDEEKAAEMLHKELKKKKFLLILDDLWYSFEFGKLGVPHKIMQKGSKILFASRQKDVCDRMNPDVYFPIRTLPIEEAWALFQRKVGTIHPDLIRTAREVCKECCGLPLAVITIGAALKNKGCNKKDISIWENALRVLRSSEFKITQMEEDVFSILKFSYDELKLKNQNCFLYCSLFPEDHFIEIDKLIEYWIMEGFLNDFNERGGNLRDAYNEGYSIVDHLLDSCLLERDNNWKDCVRMHGMIRDMAIKITRDSKECGRRYMVNARARLKKWPPAIDLERKDKISLMENDINSLVEKPVCPKLSTLLLNGNNPLETIPPEFFSSMVLLRVLDLSWTRIRSLPQSISSLVNLTALILKYCHFLENLEYVCDLKKLQFLDLEEAGIWMLPEKLCNLVQLLRLNLSCTSRLAIIPSGMISRMALLEDFQTKRSSFLHSLSFIKELRNLEQLSSLSLEIRNEQEAVCLGNSCQWENIKDFYIRVGCADPSMETYCFENIQKAILPERNGRFLDITCTDPASATGILTGAKGIMRNSEKLCLYNMPVIKTLSQVGPPNLANLKECWISECRSLKTVIAAGEAREKTLPALEILVLRKLTEMWCVWDGELTPSSFVKVRSIVLYGCPKLKYLFRLSVLKQLPCLQVLKVVKCASIKTLAQRETVRGSVGTDCIDKLRYIFLLDLPNLEMLWHGSLKMPSLEVIEVTRCPKLHKLAESKSLAPNLQVLQWQDSTEEYVDLYGNLK